MCLIYLTNALSRILTLVKSMLSGLDIPLIFRLAIQVCRWSVIQVTTLRHRLMPVILPDAASNNVPFQQNYMHDALLSRPFLV